MPGTFLGFSFLVKGVLRFKKLWKFSSKFLRVIFTDKVLTPLDYFPDPTHTIEEIDEFNILASDCFQ